MKWLRISLGFWIELEEQEETILRDKVIDYIFSNYNGNAIKLTIIQTHRIINQQQWKTRLSILKKKIIQQTLQIKMK